MEINNSQKQSVIMKKVLVAGATGYLGRFVVQEFKKQGYWVRALTRDGKKLDQCGPFGEPAVLDFIDDVYIGEVTRPETLKGLCDDIEIVFSSIGLTRQKDGLSFQDVDYQGNQNILDRAIQTGAGKFIYVSVFNAHLMEGLAIIKAHEDFVRALQNSGIPSTIIRPTGYFSDISEYFKMAKAGRAYLIGKGENCLNPIHGVDLAEVCVEAVSSSKAEISAGGPTIFTQKEIAELAFSILEKPSRILTIPLGLAKVAVNAMRLFSKHQADLFDFFVSGAALDMVAPALGTHELSEHFRQLSLHG